MTDEELDAIICDVSWIARPDATAVDALARLQLTAQRAGRNLLLVGASSELVELLELSGLAQVLPVAD